MSEVIGPKNALISNIASMSLERFKPEPKSRLGLSFGDVVQGATKVASDALGFIPGLDSSYTSLLNKQIETQQQMQMVSMESNIEKSKHETQMAAIRNVRVG